MRHYIIAILITTSSTLGAQTIKKCDLDVLRSTSVNVGRLSAAEVKQFLMTFDQTCKNNVEYSEWSNELLFLVIDQQTALLVETLEREEKIMDLNAVLDELGDPLLFESDDIKRVMKKLDDLKTSSPLVTKIEERLHQALQH